MAPLAFRLSSFNSRLRMFRCIGCGRGLDHALEFFRSHSPPMRVLVELEGNCFGVLVLVCPYGFGVYREATDRILEPILILRMDPRAPRPKPYPDLLRPVMNRTGLHAQSVRHRQVKESLQPRSSELSGLSAFVPSRCFGSRL